MLLSVVIANCETVDDDGNSSWVDVRLIASDDPERDVLDLSLVGAGLDEGDNLILGVDDLIRALGVLRAERDRAIGAGE